MTRIFGYWVQKAHYSGARCLKCRLRDALQHANSFETTAAGPKFLQGLLSRYQQLAKLNPFVLAELRYDPGAPHTELHCVDDCGEISKGAESHLGSDYLIQGGTVRILILFSVVATACLPGCATTTGMGQAVNFGCDLAMVADGQLLPTQIFPISPCKATALGIEVIDGTLTEAARILKNQVPDFDASPVDGPAK